MIYIYIYNLNSESSMLKTLPSKSEFAKGKAATVVAGFKIQQVRRIPTRHHYKIQKMIGLLQIRFRQAADSKAIDPSAPDFKEELSVGLMQGSMKAGRAVPCGPLHRNSSRDRSGSWGITSIRN